MTTPDYPLLAVPGYELYQLAHIATFIADGLVRHRRATAGRDRAGRRAASRDVHAGRTALAQACGDPQAAGPLPRPLDADTYRAAHGLLAGHPQREAMVVSLSSLGRGTWAVVGFVPGLGPVGAEVADHGLAGVLREHILHRPVGELSGWSVTDRPLRLGQDRWGSADESAAVAALDPKRAQHRAVARNLRGLSAEVDAAIDAKFAGVDLEARPRSGAPAQPSASTPARHEMPAGRAFRTASQALAPDLDDDDLELINQSDPSQPRGAHRGVARSGQGPVHVGTQRGAAVRGGPQVGR